jgi:hypothetical protein
MTTYDQLESTKIELFSNLMNTVDLARQSMNKLNELIIYLDFTNEDMIQSYYNFIQEIELGLHYFKEAYWHNAKAYGISLDKTTVQP